MTTLQTHLWAIQTTLLGLRSAITADDGASTPAFRNTLSDLSRLAEPLGGHAVTAELSRITAAGNAVSVDDLDGLLERLRTSLHTATDSEPLPWNGAIKQFLLSIWPGEIALPMRLIQDVPEFLLRAHKVMRHVHRAELLKNINKELASMEDRALAAQLAAELEPAGKLAGIFARGGDRVSHVALRELVAFAGRATGAIAPSSNPPAPTAVRPWTARASNRASTPASDNQRPDADAVADAVASCLESAAVLESDLEALTDLTQRATPELRRLASELERAQRDLERTVTDLPTLTEDVIRWIEILPEEVVDGAQNAGERLPRLLESITLTLMEIREILGTRDQEENDLRESSSIADLLDARLDALEKTAQALLPLLAASERAAGEAEALAAEDGLTAASYAKAHDRIAMVAAELGNAIRALGHQTVADRHALRDVPESLKTGAVADRVEAYEAQAAGLKSMADAYASRLEAAFTAFRKREDSLPLSPPAAAIPAVPSFASRRFQAGPDAPRSVLELLAQVDPRHHLTINAFPEIALIAPDETVYSSLLKVLFLRRRYGGRGSYVVYLDNGEFRDGYAPAFTLGPGEPSPRDLVRFVDDAGEERRRPATEMRLILALDGVEARSLEADVRDTDATYALYKAKYYTALLGVDPDAVSAYAASLQQHLAENAFSSFPAFRLQFLIAHFIDDGARRLLMERLSSKVSTEDLRRRLQVSGDKGAAMKAALERLARMNGKGLSADEKDAFLYLFGFPEMTQSAGFEERERMLDEILGTPIETLAPDLRRTGGIRRHIDRWTGRAGVIGADAARERFRHAAVLSTPEGSHLLLNKAGVRAAERFLKTRAPEGSLKDVFGNAVFLNPKGGGYRLAAAKDVTGSWYAELIRRLEVLAENPTPASDNVFQILGPIDPREAAVLRPEILGVLMEDAENSGVSRETLLDRLSLWIMHNNGRFQKMGAFRDLWKQWKKPLAG